jgi:hypothetical protein
MIDDLSANPSSEGDHRARRTRSISPITAVPMFPEAGVELHPHPLTVLVIGVVHRLFSW